VGRLELILRDGINGWVTRSEETSVTPVRDRSALAPRNVLRRRRYSADEKKAILAEASAPGSTVSEVSRRHNLTRSLIHNWRRQEAASLLGATVRFTPVTVATEMPRVMAAAPETKIGGRIEIELPGGVRVRVEGGVDEESLKRVLRALRR
jgi:transposase